MEQPKIHFITFYSQGPPYDNGLDLSKTENNVKQRVSPFVDTFKAYHCKDISDDPEFVWSIKDWSIIDPIYKRHNDGWWSPMYNKYVDINNGCDTTGFYAWKAVCILKRFNEIPYGDIVYYHDGNFDKEINFHWTKYPYYEGMNTWKSLITTILNNIKSDIFIPWEQNSGLQPLRPFCRKHCFEKMAEFTDYYTNYDCLWAGLIVMRKTKLSEQFLNDVINSLKDIELISNYPEDKDKSLKWHTWDQPIWTIMARKYIKDGLLPKNWPKYHINSRAFTPNHIKQSTHTYNM